MFETAKKEFLNWLDTYKSKTSLSSYENTLLNIIVHNFDTVASKGTASGARSNYIVKLLSDNDYVPSTSPLDYANNNISETERITHINHLHVESFRGFSSLLEFDFSKQYTTFYGTNGSGKSSLCEALEFCLLGTVQEATTRRIPLNEFLKNKTKSNFKKPILKSIVNQNEQEVIPDMESYKFAFVEKNRIDSFSHISATTPSEKTERLATLFGVSEFTDFVKGFTETLETKIVIESQKQTNLTNLLEQKEKNDQSFIDRTNEMIDLQNQINDLIITIGNPDIQDLEKAIIFLQNENGRGKINELELQNSKNQKPVYSLDFFDSISIKVNEFTKTFNKLNQLEEQLISLSVNTDLVTIYQAVTNLSEKIDHSICPICKTSVDKTVVNPFENAKQELSNLKAFSELSNEVSSYQKQVKSSIITLNKLINDHSDTLVVLGYSLLDLILPVYDKVEDFSTADAKQIINNKLQFFHQLTQNIASDKEKIVVINAEAEKNNVNNEYTVEAKRLRKIYTALLEFKGRKKTLRDNIEKIKKEIDSFESTKVNLEKEAGKEKQLNDRKQEYKKSYTNIFQSISTYCKNLPVNMASTLSSKVMEYYNLMNKGDAEFEIVQDLKMPATTDSSIIMKFKDNIEVDALQILSEGHVKLLGLAILLAKAFETKQNFIILDDIVNAIDDDHRSGVAELLYKSVDFANTQIFLTCHSESFIKKIEDCIPEKERNKKMIRYLFLDSTNESSRGIVVDYSNPKDPLELAKKSIERSEYKDAASKCRQAAESLINKLWKKLSEKLKIQISVTLAGPNAKPDFASITDGIIKQLKNLKLQKENNSVLEDLSKLKENYSWFILNKGTHYEEDQFQIEMNDICKIYDILIKFESHINEMKVGK